MLRRFFGEGLTWLGKRLLGVDPEVRPFVKEEDQEYALPLGHPPVTYGPRAVQMRTEVLKTMPGDVEEPVEEAPLPGSAAARLRRATEKV